MTSPTTRSTPPVSCQSSSTRSSRAGNRGEPAVQAVGHGLLRRIVVVRRVVLAAEEGVVEAAGDEQPVERPQPRQPVLGIRFVQTGMTEPVAAAPAERHAAAARRAEVERPVDEHLDLEARGVAEDERPHALFAAVAEHDLLHAGEGGEVSGAAAEFGRRTRGDLGHRGHSMIQPPSTLIVCPVTKLAVRADEERHDRGEFGVGAPALDRLVVEHVLRVLLGVLVDLLGLRRERAGRDGVHADAERAELAGERPGEPDGGALGRDVAREVRPAAVEGDRADVDDRPRCRAAPSAAPRPGRRGSSRSGSRGRRPRTRRAEMSKNGVGG